MRLHGPKPMARQSLALCARKLGLQMYSLALQIMASVRAARCVQTAAENSAVWRSVLWHLMPCLLQKIQLGAMAWWRSSGRL